MKIKKVNIKEFIILSEDGYFCGLHKGGQLNWSYNIKDAKPLTNKEQITTIKRFYPKEIITEYV